MGSLLSVDPQIVVVTCSWSGRSRCGEGERCMAMMGGLLAGPPCGAGGVDC